MESGLAHSSAARRSPTRSPRSGARVEAPLVKLFSRDRSSSGQNFTAQFETLKKEFTELVTLLRKVNSFPSGEALDLKRADGTTVRVGRKEVNHLSSEFREKLGELGKVAREDFKVDKTRKGPQSINSGLRSPLIVDSRLIDFFNGLDLGTVNGGRNRIQDALQTFARVTVGNTDIGFVSNQMVLSALFYLYRDMYLKDKDRAATVDVEVRDPKTGAVTIEKRKRYDILDITGTELANAFPEIDRWGLEQSREEKKGGGMKQGFSTRYFRNSSFAVLIKYLTSRAVNSQGDDLFPVDPEKGKEYMTQIKEEKEKFEKAARESNKGAYYTNINFQEIARSVDGGQALLFRASLDNDHQVISNKLAESRMRETSQTSRGSATSGRR
jgi:hypothetical protein